MKTFPKSNRLEQATDYLYVFDQANRLKSHPFLILFKPGLTQKSRLGLAISKKRIAKAHDRNRVKRIVRESFRQQQLPVLDMIIMARDNGDGLDNSTLFRQLGKIWEKLKKYYAN